jgi:hypothetical protein
MWPKSGMSPARNQRGTSDLRKYWKEAEFQAIDSHCGPEFVAHRGKNAAQR